MYVCMYNISDLPRRRWCSRYNVLKRFTKNETKKPKKKKIEPE